MLTRALDQWLILSPKILTLTSFFKKNIKQFFQSNLKQKSSDDSFF